MRIEALHSCLRSWDDAVLQWLESIVPGQVLLQNSDTKDSNKASADKTDFKHAWRRGYDYGQLIVGVKKMPTSRTQEDETPGQSWNLTRKPLSRPERERASNKHLISGSRIIPNPPSPLAHSPHYSSSLPESWKSSNPSLIAGTCVHVQPLKSYRVPVHSEVTQFISVGEFHTSEITRKGWKGTANLRCLFFHISKKICNMVSESNLPFTISSILVV